MRGPDLPLMVVAQPFFGLRCPLSASGQVEVEVEDLETLPISQQPYDLHEDHQVDVSPS